MIHSMSYIILLYFLGEAIIWNKKTFTDSERGRFFNDIGIESIRDAQAEVRKAKSRFFAENNGRQVSVFCFINIFAEIVLDACGYSLSCS